MNWKQNFFRIPIVFELLESVLHVLPLKLIFQFQRDDGNAVEGQDHVDRVGIVFGIRKLPRHAQNIAAIKGALAFVQFRLGLKKTNLDVDPHVVHAVFQDLHKPVFPDAGLEAPIEFFGSAVAVIAHVTRPLLGLGPLDKVEQYLGIERFLLIVDVFMYSVPIRVEVGKLLVTALVADQKSFDVAFKAFFGCVHGYFSCNFGRSIRLISYSTRYSPGTIFFS